MSASDFRQIALRGDEGRAERLFRAAVSAFCSLTRPSGKDASQLDDLTLPLYDQVPADSLRYVAAALSECRRAPTGLVRRLAGEPVETSAPILMRSAVLTDIDLVALIAREGIGHARAIAGRPGLNPAIARLVRALEAATTTEMSAREPDVQDGPASGEEETVMTGSLASHHPEPGSAAEAARSRLRSMMAVGGDAQPALAAPPVELTARHYARLRDTALTGAPALFQTALADAAQIAYSQAVPLTSPDRRRSLVLVLRGLGLSAEQAFVLVSAIAPASHPHAEAVRLFVEHFSLTHVEAGRDEIRRLRADSIATVVAQPREAPAGWAMPERLLRAS